MQKPLFKDGNLIIDDEIVVSQNEDALQQTLANHLCTSRDTRILEVGYGLGLAHHRLQYLSPAEHWVIEGNKWLAKKCIDFAGRHRDLQPIVIFDTWEHAFNLLPLAYFDSILFDPYPFDEEAKQLSSWPEKFQFVSRRAAKGLFRNLKPDGRLGVINFSPVEYGEDWMREQFLGLFELEQIAKVSQNFNAEESWILKKTKE